jgi:hypothetical protein
MRLARRRYFFVTDRATFLLMRQKYHAKIPGVTIVLLPQGEVLEAEQKHRDFEAEQRRHSEQ